MNQSFFRRFLAGFKSEGVFHPFGFERVDFSNNSASLPYCLGKGRRSVSTQLHTKSKHLSLLVPLMCARLDVIDGSDLEFGQGFCLTNSYTI